MTEMLTGLTEALDSGDSEAIADQAEAVATRVSRLDADAATDAGSAALGALRRKRRYAEMLDVADATIAAGSNSPTVYRQYAQAMIEQGHLGAALAILSDQAQRTDLGDEAAEIDGLIGRAHKQRYVESPQHGDDLRASIEAYSHGFEEDPQTNRWHGVNAVATLARAETDGLAERGDPDWRSMAEALASAIEATPAAERNEWDAAIAAEAKVALGDFGSAATWLGEYTTRSNADAFEYAGTLRQLREVWRVDESQPEQRALVDLLEANLLRARGADLTLGEGAAVRARQLDGSSAYLEGVFGKDEYKTIRWYRSGLEAARSVVRINRPLGKTIGTGFVVAGEHLRDDWAGSRYVVTNFHVVNRHGVHPGLEPSDVRVMFDDDQTEIRVEEVMAESPVAAVGSNPPASFDVAVLRLAAGPPSPSYVPVSQAPSTGSRLYAIGYPRGQELAFSLHDNELIATANGVLHYRSPTRPGSSGSPLFDDAWQLVGLHHASGANMPSLENGDETYEANEGFLLEVFKNEF